jgi:formate dehydrogenase iron-sulfur subunit
MGNGVMYKCDLCADRLAANQTPGCIEACPREALLIGTKSSIEKLARHRADRISGYIYGNTQNGGTATLYVSPVPFTEINKTMTKKPGQPDMKENVPRRMAGTDPLAKAVLAAPVLGMAAGVLGWLLGRKGKAEGRD